MSLDVIDGAGNVRQLASDVAGTVHTPIHKISGLPGSSEGDIAASKGFLQTLAAAVATVTTNLATLASAITAARMAVDVDSTTQGKLDALAAKLDTVSAAQGAPAALYGGRTTVPTAGTRVVLGASQVLTEGVLMRGLDANAGLVYPGNSAVTATTNGTRLIAKEPLFIRINNVNKVYIDAATSGEGVSWIGW